MKKIRKSVMSSGSFGISGQDQLVTVWYCGAWKVRRGPTGRETYGAPWKKQTHSELHMGNTSQPCVHRTKAEAGACRAGGKS